METLQRTANRGSISTASYEIDNSLKLERDNSENIYRQIIDGNRRTWTSSLWVKRVDTATPSYNLFFNHGIYGVGTYLRFNNDDTLTAAIEYYGGGTSQVTNAKFRDTSAWMHIVWRVDTTQSTEADRSRIYINGAQITSFSSATYPSQNTETLANHDHGGYDDVEFGYKDAGIYSNMYYADVYHVDGQSLAPTEFGEYDSASGIWKPIEADISDFGNNGFYLDFSNASSLGTDSAGNGSFTLSNVTAADQATDTPTNNFCTMNTNFKTSSSIVVSEGQTKITCGSGTGWLSNVATFALTKGKWYYEVASVTSVYQIFGIADASDDKIPQASGGYYVGYGSDDTTLSVGMYMLNGQAYGNQDGGSGVGIAPSAVGDIMSVCLDLDNLGFYIMRNGVSPSGSDPSSGSSLTGAFTWNDSIYSGYYYPAMSVFQNNALETNFGGYTSNPISSAATDANGYGNFEYAPPSGYYAICSQNLALYG